MLLHGNLQQKPRLITLQVTLVSPCSTLPLSSPWVRHNRVILRHISEESLIAKPLSIKRGRRVCARHGYLCLVALEADGDWRVVLL